MVVGDKVRVIQAGSHGFKVGQVVTITCIDGENSFICDDGTDYWWLRKEEFELLNQEQ